MLENENRNDNNNDEIDLVDFSSNREMDRIRENERIEREKRRRHAEQVRRAESLKQKKLAAIKQAVTAWAILAVAVIAVVAGVTALIGVITKDDEPEKAEVGSTISAEDKESIETLKNSKKYVLAAGAYSPLDDMLKNLATDVDYDGFLKERSSYLAMASRTFSWNGNADNSSFEELVRNYPIFKNGYVWSSKDSMKSPVTEGYLYDTNASYISAVANICLWRGDTSFLYELDNDGEKNGDVSNGMTVGEKLDLAVGHFFDENDVNGGGARYNKNDKLFYILTETNGGNGNDKPSNIFFNHRFGFLDLYGNLTFNAAMSDLAALYKLSGNMEKAEYYDSIASDNKNAVNNKFYDKDKGRFVGCIDNSGAVHDGGFVSLNLLAVSMDICDDETAKSILSRFEGKGAFENECLPSFSTVSATDSWWDYRDGRYPLSGTAKFGKYWQNGGESAITGYFDLLTKNNDSAISERVKKLSKAYKDGAFTLPKKDESGLNEPQLHYGAYAGEAVRRLFGISTDGKTLTVSPAFDIRTEMGIKNIAFADKNYSILYEENAVFVMSDTKAAVKINLGGFDGEESVEVVTVEEDTIEKTETLRADKNGLLSISKKFGDTSLIKIVRQPEAEEK